MHLRAIVEECLLCITISTNYLTIMTSGGACWSCSGAWFSWRPGESRKIWFCLKLISKLKAVVESGIISQLQDQAVSIWSRILFYRIVATKPFHQRLILQYLEEAELQELLATKWVKINVSFGIYSFDFVFYLGMIYIGLWVLVVGILFRYKLFVEYTFKRSFWQFLVYINFLFVFRWSQICQVESK